MAQKKINSFFKDSKSRSRNMSHFINANSSGRTSSCMYNLYNPMKQYQDSRKQQKKMKAEAIMMNSDSNKQSSQSSQFTQSLEINDGSQNNYPPQSQDVDCWPQRPAGFSSSITHFGTYSNTGRSKYDLNASFSRSRDFEQYVETVKQEQREKYDNDMLQNFLLSAKRCCEEANDISKNVHKNLDDTSSRLLQKMKDQLETTMPKLLQTMVESNKERELCLQNKLEKLQVEVSSLTSQLSAYKDKFDQIATVESLLKNMIKSNESNANQLQLNALQEAISSITDQLSIFKEGKIDQIASVEHLLRTMNKSSESSQKQLQAILFEIHGYVSKTKPLLCEMASQYSPQNEVAVGKEKDQAKGNARRVEKHDKGWHWVSSQSEIDSPLLVEKPLNSRSPFADISTKNRVNFPRSNIKRTPKKVIPTLKQDFGKSFAANRERASTALFGADRKRTTVKGKARAKKSKQIAKSSVQPGTSGAFNADLPQVGNWNFRLSKNNIKENVNLLKTSKTKSIRLAFANLSDSDASDSTYNFTGLGK